MNKLTEPLNYNDLYQVVVNKIQEGKDLIKMNMIGVPLIAGGAIYLAYKDHPVMAISFGASSLFIGSLTYVVNRKIKKLNEFKKDLESELN
ncbi:MAG: hypothetical protein AABY32_00275 [Nanoarchaeota archaeon]